MAQAESESYRRTTVTKAEAEAVWMQADGSACAERAIADAQACPNTVRAASLENGNQELIAANDLIEVLPSLVEAAARGSPSRT